MAIMAQVPKDPEVYKQELFFLFDLILRKVIQLECIYSILFCKSEANYVRKVLAVALPSYLSTRLKEPGCQWRCSGTRHVGPAGW